MGDPAEVLKGLGAEYPIQPGCLPFSSQGTIGQVRIGSEQFLKVSIPHCRNLTVSQSIARLNVLAAKAALIFREVILVLDKNCAEKWLP